ncbi:MAG: hypothetical protein JJE13_09565 [Thermoleophilia bacterium]|nr:hypothetical protein [Thermoleophilia bacterium]
MSRISSRIALIGVGAVLVAAGVAGCGGSSDDSSSDALSKDDYIAQANEICSNLTADVAGLGDDFSSSYGSGEYEAASITLSDGNDKINTALDELKALTPPEEDQATIDEYLSLNDDQSEISDQLVDAVADGDDTKIKDLGAQIDELQVKSDKIADDYGITECGSASNA